MGGGGGHLSAAWTAAFDQKRKHTHTHTGMQGCTGVMQNLMRTDTTSCLHPTRPSDTLLPLAHPHLGASDHMMWVVERLLKVALSKVEQTLLKTRQTFSNNGAQRLHLLWLLYSLHHGKRSHGRGAQPLSLSLSLHLSHSLTPSVSGQH